MNNKQQVIHIHGGDSFSKYEDYISSLKKREFNPYKTNKNRWNRNHYRFLDENDFEIFRPDMPCSWNAHYNEWKIWFEKIFPYLNSQKIILIGHSLGGLFLAKYLSENIFPFSIKQLHLIAPVYGNGNDVGDFSFQEFPNKLFKNKIEEIHLYHSDDDKVVPITDSEKYFEKLPQAHFHRFTDRGHFLDETFPELFENIKKSQ